MPISFTNSVWTGVTREYVAQNLGLRQTEAGQFVFFNEMTEAQIAQAYSQRILSELDNSLEAHSRRVFQSNSSSATTDKENLVEDKEIFMTTHTNNSVTISGEDDSLSFVKNGRGTTTITLNNEVIVLSDNDMLSLSKFFTNNFSTNIATKLKNKVNSLVSIPDTIFKDL